ncbi:MAG: Asp-tRNA(Asn)/Glu-tRNA(Gln) amidotransferase subunit GatA [Alphaproteobacteria bacterium]|nr:Asp-tRNA(Asn)/Glu-tRNA(Gln) amidotransferase subunit GatA [Alphaproteobacteria bacterium]
MDNLTDMTIAAAREGLRRGEFSATELTEAYLVSIEASNGAINAYVLVTHEIAREMARGADDRLRRGEGRALEGIPLGIKDMFCTRAGITQAGSRILNSFKPSYESTVSSNLWSDGAVMLGKLNMDEFGMGSSNETSCFGPTINPYRIKGTDIPLTAGGSSGGSAAAVAARLCAGALGTDTGGSIRQPGALTGIVGIKPTYGRCSRWGMIAFVSSLDQAGPMARTVRDCAIVLESMAGYDPKDSTSVDMPVPAYESALTGDVKGTRIGIPKEYRLDSMPAEIEQIWQRGIDWLRDAGAEIVDVSLPHTRYALPAYYILAPAESSSNLLRYDGVRYGFRAEGDDIVSMYENTRTIGFGPEVKRRIMIGTYVLSSSFCSDHYLKARKVRTLIHQDFERAFEKVDVLLTPVTPSAAFPLGTSTLDPVRMYHNDIFTVAVNIAGLPAMVVPSGVNADGLPLGLQVIGRAFDEPTLFRVGEVLESAAGPLPRPDVWWR